MLTPYRDHSQLGKTAIQLTTHFRSCPSAPHRKTKRKGSIKHNNIINDCNDTDPTATSPGLPAVCPTTTPGVEKTTPVVTELASEQVKDAFCLQVAGTVGTPRSCSSYVLHVILVCTASLHGTIQTIVPNMLQPRLVHIARDPKLAGHLASIACTIL